jgi:NADH:ubiquinone oxidoreductase subunit 6 (subunit J)
VFGAGAIACALAVALNRNIVHCALYLGTTFICVAALYLLLDAGFLAAVQILIYVGAITVLILFAILLSEKMLGGQIKQHNRQSIPAAALVAVLVWMLITSVSSAFVDKAAPASAADPAAARFIGLSLLGPYVIPFEIASLALLVAMIGAIIIARKD